MNRIFHILHSTILSCMLLASAWTPSAMAQNQLAVLVGDGGVMLRSPSGETLVSMAPDRAIVPASLVKIPLAQVALTLLGEDFRFETHFYRNDDGDLLIRGLGDPFLVSEEIARIADSLAVLGLDRVRRIVVDDSAFESSPELPIEGGSDQPYAARNSALAANFNTVNLAWTADGSLISNEPQTPLTDLARKLAASLPPGEPQRINLGDEASDGLRQLQQLFQHFLAESGINIADTDFYQESVTEEWTLFYKHRSSQSFRDNLEGMLRYSNNFIANQVFLTLGADKGGYPASSEVARAVLQQQLAELYGEGFGRESQTLLMLEGSGLSRKQRSTAAGMMRILEVFKPYASLLPEVDGVLRKSGTLTGVYNFAGYIRGSDGLYPFVILTEQAANKRGEILQYLQRQL